METGTSLVLATDYRVEDVDRWLGEMRRWSGDLGRIGARHVVIYQGLKDAHRTFVTIGIRDRRPLGALLRSPAVFEFFDRAGVSDIPPIFAGEVVAKLDLGNGEPAGPAGVVAATVAQVPDVDQLLSALQADTDRMRRFGVRKFWLYRGLDAGDEVMVLQEIDTPEHAELWIRHRDAGEAWMAGVGVGVHPAPFVGELAHVIGPEEG